MKPGKLYGLVLSRAKNEAITIGDDIRVTVIDIAAHKVRLAVKAPKHVPVHREEVARRIKAEQEAGR